jgi:hypothetical protein
VIIRWPPSGMFAQVNQAPGRIHHFTLAIHHKKNPNLG